MSQKTKFLKNLFTRIGGDRRRRRDRRSKSNIEMLESRIALAIDVVVAPQSSGGIGEAAEQWLTVLVDNGSDVFLKMDATPTNDLRIADNSLFDPVSGNVTSIPSVDSEFDTIYVYNGSVVDQQVQFPSDEKYSSGQGLLPTSYANVISNSQDLTFLLNTRTIDQAGRISGSIQLGDINGTEISFRNIDVDNDNIYENVWEIVDSSVPISVTFGASGPLTTISVNSAALAGAGSTAMPTLNLDYDYDLDLGAADEDRFQAQSGVIPSSPTSAFNLFNQTSHAFVPGTLQGELSVHFSSLASVPLAFQVETTGTGIVDVSFGTESNLNLIASGIDDRLPRSLRPYFDLTVPHTPGLIGGVGFNNRFVVTGQFNTETGELSFTTEIDNTGSTGLSNGVGGPINLPLIVDNLQIGLRDISASDDDVDLLGTKNDDLANVLTVFPGGNFTRNLVAELPNTASEISIENPVVAATGPNAHDGFVSLSAGRVLIETGVRAPNRFLVPSGENTAFGTITEVVEINAPVSAPSIDIRLSDNSRTGNIERSRLEISRRGSLSDVANVTVLQPDRIPAADRADFVFLEIEDGDAFIQGNVAASEHSYVMRSGLGSEVNGPYIFTTESDITGVQLGEISGGLLSMLLANDTLGDRFQSYQTMVSRVDLQTSVERMRMQAGTRMNHSADFPFPYDISIREADNLIIDAVAASSGKIDVAAEGTLALISSINSMGDVKLESGDDFTVNAPVATSFGSIEIRGPQVNVENSVRVYGGVAEPLRTDISIEATEGQLLIEDAVAAINSISLTANGNNGTIVGSGRLIGDSVEGVSSGDIVIRTDSNVVSVRTPGVVRLDDQSAVAFEVVDSPDVTLIANGLDDVVAQNDGTKQLSPSLFGNVIGASEITVSAPRGSIDLLHNGTNSLEVGDGAAIAASPELDVERMTAAGSVIIRSNSAQDMVVSDAPSATSGATTVRFATAQPFPMGTFFGRSTLPGVYPTTLIATLTMGSDKSLEALGGVIATDIKTGDFILVKDGLELHSLVGIEQISDTELQMPETFISDESVVNKRIEGSSFAAGTDVIDYNPDTRILEISQPLVGAVNAQETIRIFDRSCNGIYGVSGLAYQQLAGSQTAARLSLRRVSGLAGSPGFDTTLELSGRQYFRVTDGAQNGDHSTAGKVFVSEGFSNKISSSSVPTPVFVRPVFSRPGFVTANAISTKAIPAVVTESGDLLGTENGSIGFDADLFDGVVLGIGRRVLIQSPLVDSPDAPTSHYGLYTVVSPGSENLPWRLRRYAGVDENGDGNINEFHTGVVALTQGSLRTAVTGEMYEIGFDSINNAELSYREITDFRKVNTATGGTYLTESFDPTQQYRTDIGTRNVLGTVTYQVSSEGGRNDDPGSFGRMLALLQGNTASVERLGSAQLTRTTFHDSVQNIQLEQELPEINSPIEVTPNREVIVDGSRIIRTRDDAVVRTGSLRAQLGPASPSANPANRRLVRGPATALSFDQVNGLEIGPGGQGSIIGNLSIGGFSNGTGIAVFGADNVLLNNVRVGVDAAGNQMSNAVGIQIEQAAGGENARFTTVRNSTIAANSVAGISLGTNVDDVRLVGNVIGRNRASNEVGVIVDTGDSGIARLGVRDINPTAAVVGLPVTPLESYPGDIPRLVLPNVYDPAPTSRVSISKNAATDAFEPGLQLFDRTTNQMWTVRKIDLSADELNYEMVIKGPQIDVGSLGMSLALEAGYFVDAPQRAETLRLPSGIDPARLYLGQRVASTVVGVLEQGTYITSIAILPPPNLPEGAALPEDTAQVGHYGGIVEIGLSTPVANSAQTGLLFENAGRNAVGFNNDGIILRSGSSSIVSTDVTYSNFDGIRIEGVAEAGMHMIGGAQGTSLTSESVTISANLRSGLKLTESFFAGYAEGEKQDRFDQVKIRGNVFGTDLLSTPGLSNGRDGESNIVIADVPLNQRHQGSQDRDDLTGRYTAIYRPEDNPEQSEELEEFEGFDNEGNNHFAGDPLTIIDTGGGFGDGDSDDWFNTPPTLY